jgi:hypothetical protein
MYAKIVGAMSLFCLMLAGQCFFPAMRQGHAQENSELERIAQCGRDLCDILRLPLKEGRPLQCEIGRTLYKEQIEKAMRARKLFWPLGDARCTLTLNVERGIVTRVMTQDRYTLKLPKQPAICDVEYRGTHYPVTLSMAPEFAFSKGRATTVRLGVQDIEANIIVKALIWSAAKLEDRVGVFQSDFVSGVNTYVESVCRAKPVLRRQVKRDAATVR